jgi:hypothetical protein
MIIKDGSNEWIACTLCSDRIELSKDDAASPLTVRTQLQKMRAEHKDCEQFALDPARARAERIYRVGMRVEWAALVLALSSASVPSY